jgi:hypothetical protein
VSIAIGTFADMDRLTDFEKWWLIRRYSFRIRFQWTKTPFSYFPNLVEAVLGKFNATPFLMAHNIPFHELQARVALHIWPHSIKISADQSNPYDIPNDTLCNSQILSQKCMPKTNKEDNDSSLLVMENGLFDRLMDAMQDQPQAMYNLVDHHVYHFSNSCDNAQPLHNSVIDSSSTPPHLNEPTIQDTPDGNEISSISPNLNRPTIQETPDSNEISITPPYFNALPIQETPDGNDITTSSESNISP